MDSGFLCAVYLFKVNYIWNVTGWWKAKAANASGIPRHTLFPCYLSSQKFTLTRWQFSATQKPALPNTGTCSSSVVHFKLRPTKLHVPPLGNAGFWVAENYYVRTYVGRRWAKIANVFQNVAKLETICEYIADVSQILRLDSPNASQIKKYRRMFGDCSVNILRLVADHRRNICQALLPTKHRQWFVKIWASGKCSPTSIMPRSHWAFLASPMHSRWKLTSIMRCSGGITEPSANNLNSESDVHQCITEVSRIYHRPSQQNNQQLSPNVRRTLDYIGDALANIRQTNRKSIFFHRNCWYLCSKSQGIGKHRVYNYTFYHRRCKNPQWDRGTKGTAAFNCPFLKPI